MFSRNADTNHVQQANQETTKNKLRKKLGSKGNNQSTAHSQEKTLMLKVDHDKAKRCTKYETNLETISCHFSLKLAYSGSIIETVDSRDDVAYLASASQVPFYSLGIHLYLKKAFL